MKYILLLIIPVVIILNVSYNNKTEFAQDPNYIYLFNGLNLAAYGGPVGQYDNPGTPVSILAGLIMKVIHFVRNTENDLATDVLQNPQYYTGLIIWILTIVNCILIFFLGLFILKTTNELMYSFLFQAIPFFSKSTVPWCFQTLCPEPLLLGATIILSGLFLWKFYFNKSFGVFTIRYYKDLSINIDRFIIYFGILMGFCLATKINTLPILLLPLFFIPGIVNKFIFMIITFFSFLVFTFPIRHLYKYMISWYLGIATHTEIYGSGDKGFIDYNVISSNFLMMVKKEPLILYILGLTAIILLKQILRKKYDINFKILSVLFMVQMGDMLMVLKHFNPHYFIPILATLALNLFIIIKSLNLSGYLRSVVIIAIIVFAVYLNKNVTKYIPELYNKEFPADGINITSYKSKSPMYALKFGDDRSVNANSEKLKTIYGDQYFYDIWTRQFVTWNDTLTLDSLFRINNKVYLHAIEVYMEEWKPVFEITRVSEDLFLINNSDTSALKK